MPYKDKKRQQEYKKQYNEKYYENNKQCFRDRNKEVRKKCTKYIKEYKEKGKCKYCDESESICLDFNHRDPKEKKFTIANHSHGRIAFGTLLNEIKKCDLVCANCHRKLHKYGIIYFS